MIVNTTIVSITRVKMGLPVIVELQTTRALVCQSTWDHSVKLGTIAMVKYVAGGARVKMAAVVTRVIVSHSIGEITVN
jgi:hypothetical protein